MPHSASLNSTTTARHTNSGLRLGLAVAAMLLPLAGLGSTASAQVLHDADVVIRMDDADAIEFGTFQPGGDILWGTRTARGRLDIGQFPNLTDDPGFDSFSGSFPAGTQIGFDLLAALRLWDGDDFETIDPDYAMSVTKGDQVATTPAIDGRVPGFTFGSADSGGRFHHHVRFFLDPFEFNAVPGLWLLELELWSTNPAVLPSEPFYLVFASGSEALGQQEDALAWVEQNLIGGLCNPADIAEPSGILDLADIGAFVGGFTGGDLIADLAEPFGVYDLADIATFVNAFTAGCP
jgi:hypothetical protein